MGLLRLALPFCILICLLLLLLLGSVNELSRREDKGDIDEEGIGWRGSVRWENEIRNKCVHGVVLSKNVSETNSDFNARTQL